MGDKWSYSHGQRLDILRVIGDAINEGDVIRISTQAGVYVFQPNEPPAKDDWVDLEDPNQQLPPPPSTLNTQQQQVITNLLKHAMLCQNPEGTCPIGQCSSTKTYLLNLETHSKTCKDFNVLKRRT